MRPSARYDTATRARLLWNRRLPVRLRPGPRGVRFSRGWRARVMRAMRLAFSPVFSCAIFVAMNLGAGMDSALWATAAELIFRGVSAFRRLSQA
jgi:hypothetical protein